MPVISMISPKGGVGKTTAATVLATQLASGAKVVVIDADPNRPIAAWAALDGKPDNVTVVSDVTEENIIDKIDDAATEAPFVIVDCEGTASLTVAYAIGAADLVIIPTQGSQLDAKQAARALALIRNQEKQARRRIKHRVLLTRTNPVIKPRTLSNITSQFAEAGVEVMETQLNEREAFRAMFSFGGGLRQLDAAHVANIDKAEANARAFVTEIIDILRAPSLDAKVTGGNAK